jgi:hypothetical protein
MTVGIAQVPLVHTRPVLHIAPVQHACPIAPQVIERRQVPASPDIMHDSPGSHARPQQGWSIPPHGGGIWQVPEAQLLPLEHVSPGQQGWPVPPQVTQLPDWHASPA